MTGNLLSGDTFGERAMLRIPWIFMQGRSKEEALLAFGIGINVLIVGITLVPGLTVGLALVGLTIWFILVNTSFPDRQFVFRALLIACGLKISLVILYQSYLVFGGAPIFAPDGETFSKFGWYISRIFLGKDYNALPSAEHVYWNYDVLIRNQLYGALPPYSMYQIGAYGYFLGYLYTFFGYSPILARIINIVLSTLTAFLVMRIIGDLSSSREAKAAFVLVLFWPSLSLFSLGILRDPAIVLGIVLVMWSIHRLSLGAAPAIFGVIVGIGLVYILRWEAAIILLITLFFWVLKRLFHFRRTLLVGALVGVFLLGLGRVDQILKDKLAVMVAHHIGYQNPGEVGGFTGVYYNILPPHLGPDSRYNEIIKLSWVEMGEICLRGVVHYLTEPWPTHLKTTKLKAFFPLMVLWYTSLIFAVPGIYVLWRSNTSFAVLIVVLLALFVSLYGMSEGNIGTLIRHRDMITPAILILAVMGLSKFFGESVDLCKN